MLICSHLCLRSLTTKNPIAKGTAYTIGGGPHENTFCASLKGAGADTDAMLRL